VNLERLDASLKGMAAGLEETGWAAELCAPDWTLVYVSSQLRALLGHPSDEDLGLGEHIVVSRQRPAYDRFVSEASGTAWLSQNVPHMLDSTPGGRAAILEMVDRPASREVVATCAEWTFPAWTGYFGWEPYGDVRFFAQRPRDRDGRPYGTVYLYGSTLPATLLTLVARGDSVLFERMARLAEPGRHEAAVLFADLQASGTLSRRLSSTAYFRTLTALTTAMDRAVIDAGGIVGKHAGDGLTAFFLCEDLGSPSATARAALSAARHLAAAARAAGGEAGEPVELNVGVHWGGTLYMGQLVTDGRLEVTALGDEVNECARIQQVARDGAILASKPLLERLDEPDAAHLGLDLDALHYTPLADVPGAGEKAVRDAGTLPVARVRSL
jgi:class 3 adenylate cyclase